MNQQPPQKNRSSAGSGGWLLGAGVAALLAVGTALWLLSPGPGPVEPAAPVQPAPATIDVAPDAAIGSPLPAPDPAEIALGGRVYAETCAACHGANLEGQPNWQTRNQDGKLPAPPHDETGHSWHHPDAQLFAITKFGLAPIAGPDYATDMPAFEGRLTDAEILAALAYIKSRWPEKIRARQAEIDARARTQQQE